MKTLLEKLFKTNISISYMFILFGICALMMVGYFSYAWFTVQGVQKYSVVTGNLTATLVIGDNSITINGAGIISYTPTTNQDVITIKVTNTSNRDAKNSIYYYDLADTNIVVGYAADSENIPLTTGVVVEKDKSLTYKIVIINSKGKEIQIGSSMGLINDNLSLPVNAKEIVKTEDSYCQDNGFTTLSDCMLVIANHEASADAAKTAIKAKGTPDFTKVATTDEGLYMAEDDEGESYYYRGAVKNNYVSFAGFIWRIIRRNGDGSIRLIYSGKSTSDTGDAVTIGTSVFNDKYWDSTYVGYKYNEDFSLHESNGTTEYNWFTNTQKYNFGTGYTFDQSTKKFTLTGNIKELTWNDNHDEIVNNNLYSCLNTSYNVVYKIVGYISTTQMRVQPISYSSNSLLSAQTNKTDSPIKIKLDNWYKTNLTSYNDKLADEAFCSDRSIASGTGYTTDSYTFYGAFARLQDNKTPSLKCSQNNDKFKMSNESAKLDYPVGLILADEVAFAGGRAYYNGEYSPNSNYYLYDGMYFWTFSPSYFEPHHSNVHVWRVMPSGSLMPWYDVTDSIGVRPVINLKANTLITKGDGSSLNPFVVS